MFLCLGTSVFPQCRKNWWKDKWLPQFQSHSSVYKILVFATLKAPFVYIVPLQLGHCLSFLFMLFFCLKYLFFFLYFYWTGPLGKDNCHCLTPSIWNSFLNQQFRLGISLLVIILLMGSSTWLADVNLKLPSSISFSHRIKYTSYQ